MNVLDVLDCPQREASSGQHCVASAAIRIHDYGRAFRAELAVDEEVLQVVLKFATSEDGRQELVKEAQFYNEVLLRVQTIFVPEYIGIFGIDSAESIVLGHGKIQGPITCLVVTYVGEGLTRPIQELDVKERYFIFMLMGIIHGLGIWHGDVHARNFRIDPDSQTFWLIDFGKAKKHKCKRKKVQFGGPVPSLKVFGCYEMYKLAVQAKIWVSYGRWTFFSIPVPLDDIDQWEDLVPYTPSSLAKDEQIRSAQAAFEKVLSVKNDIFLEYEKENEWFWTGLPSKSPSNE